MEGRKERGRRLENILVEVAPWKKVTGVKKDVRKKGTMTKYQEMKSYKQKKKYYNNWK